MDRQTEVKTFSSYFYLSLFSPPTSLVGSGDSQPVQTAGRRGEAEARPSDQGLHGRLCLCQEATRVAGKHTKPHEVRDGTSDTRVYSIL